MGRLTVENVLQENQVIAEFFEETVFTTLKLSEVKFQFIPQGTVQRDFDSLLWPKHSTRATCKLSKMFSKSFRFREDIRLVT